MFFVFNINEDMLKENEFIYRQRDLNPGPFDFPSPFGLNSQSQLPFMIQHHDSVPVQPISLKADVK